MSLILDQTWVSDWRVGPPDLEKLATIQKWMRTLSPQQKALARLFPPMCLVAATDKSLEVPYPYSLGVVLGYFDDGGLGVAQTPSSDTVRVVPEKLMLVGFWKNFNHQQVLSVLGAPT